jgi:iron complex outermembrane receptor protein
MFKNISLFLLSFISFLSIQAQIQIKSKVVDAKTQQVVAGASVSNGQQTVLTDNKGNWMLSCVGSSKITITHIGYKKLSMSIDQCKLPDLLALEPDETLLETVEVNASSNPNKALLYQPLSITKVNKAELNRGNGLFLDDAIQTNVTGVSMNRRSVGGGQQLNIRGYGNGTRGTRGMSSNFDGQGYKVYLNGIAVTDAEGITTFDDIDFSSLQNVEITKGPSGTLYGLAIAGAVNLTTLAPEKGKTLLSQQVLLGNYGLARKTTSFQTANEKSSLLLNYGKQSSDGFTVHNSSKKDYANLMASFQPSSKQSIHTYFGYSDSYDERAGELTIAQYESNDYSGNPDYIKRNGHSHVVTFRAGLSHNYQFADWISNSTSVFGTAFNSDASSAAGWTDKGSLNFGIRSAFTTKFNLKEGIALTGVTGLEFQKQIANTIGYSMKKDPYDLANDWVLGLNPYWVINAATSNVYAVSKTQSLFSEWTLNLPSDFTITAGIGNSYLNLYLNDRFNAAIINRPSVFEKKYQGMNSPHFAINKVFNKNYAVFASYSRGFKAPVSSYFYITTPAVATTPPTPASGSLNDVLKPEESNQFELGHRGKILNDRLFYELIYFNTIFSNKMTTVAVASPLNPNTTLYSYVVNGGKQMHKGLEANFKWLAYESTEGLLRQFRPFANMTFSNFTYGNGFTIQKSVTLTENYSGKSVAAVAKYVANMGFDFLLGDGFYGNITYNYRDKMPITSLNDYYTTSYSLVNGKLGYQHKLSKRLSIDANFGINNLFGTKYFIMVFANQLPDAYVPAASKPQNFGSFTIKYDF